MPAPFFWEMYEKKAWRVLENCTSTLAKTNVITKIIKAMRECMSKMDVKMLHLISMKICCAERRQRGES